MSPSKQLRRQLTKAVQGEGGRRQAAASGGTQEHGGPGGPIESSEGTTGAAGVDRESVDGGAQARASELQNTVAATLAERVGSPCADPTEEAGSPTRTREGEEQTAAEAECQGWVSFGDAEAGFDDSDGGFG
jgi:hypothetical protein